MEAVEDEGLRLGIHRAINFDNSDALAMVGSGAGATNKRVYEFNGGGMALRVQDRSCPTQRGNIFAKDTLDLQKGRFQYKVSFDKQFSPAGSRSLADINQRNKGLVGFQALQETSYKTSGLTENRGRWGIYFDFFAGRVVEVYENSATGNMDTPAPGSCKIDAVSAGLVPAINDSLIIELESGLLGLPGSLRFSLGRKVIAIVTKVPFSQTPVKFVVSLPTIGMQATAQIASYDLAFTTRQQHALHRAPISAIPAQVSWTADAENENENEGGASASAVTAGNPTPSKKLLSVGIAYSLDGITTLRLASLGPHFDIAVPDAEVGHLRALMPAVVPRVDDAGDSALALEPQVR